MPVPLFVPDLLRHPPDGEELWTGMPTPGSAKSNNMRCFLTALTAFSSFFKFFKIPRVIFGFHVSIYEYDANGRIIAATTYTKGVERGKMVYECEGNRFKQMTIYTSKDDKVGTTGYTKMLPESLYELQDY